ncbi:MAG: redoxin domain-containing protein, partial [Bacteroidales bacterium]|nr:redoxin domain-containing protein [Bacteroidales bacterium]
MMKKILLLVVGIILSINISAQCPLTTAVDFTATDCHGTEIHLFDILDGGQYVLIDFFYTTCGPCIQATPKVAEAYTMLGCNDFEVFFMEITPSDNDAACQTWCNNFGIEYPTIGTNGGGGTICNTYQIGAYPTLILIAPDRSIVIQDLWPIDNAMTIVNALDPFQIQQHECGSAPTCDAPQNVAAVVNDDLSITVSWDDVAEAVSYTLYVDGEMTAEGISGTTVTSPANQIPGT